MIVAFCEKSVKRRQLIVKNPQAVADQFGTGWGWGSYFGEPYEDSIDGSLVRMELVHY